MQPGRNHSGKHGKVGKVWFIKTELLWDSLRAKKRLQLLSAGLGSGRDLQSPIWAVSSEFGFGFSLSVRLAMGSPLGATPALLQGVCLLQFCPFFLSPCCSSESLGELSISQLVLLILLEEEPRGSP